MAEKGSPKIAPPPSAPAPVVVVDPYEDLDSGVYRKLRDNWVQIQTELVNWKTGGGVKSFATEGLKKGDVSGRFNGGASPTQMTTPLEFLIKAPEGAQGTDFRLVHLQEDADAREFRTVAGGIFHAPGGALRDEVAFEQPRLQNAPISSCYLAICLRENMCSSRRDSLVLPRPDPQPEPIPFELWSRSSVLLLATCTSKPRIL